MGDRIYGRPVVPVQEDDGYLSTAFGRGGLPPRYSDLEWGHELYCYGHLIQAGVARARTGRDDLLVDIARRGADHVCATFADGGIERVGGHPEVELGLVETGPPHPPPTGAPSSTQTRCISGCRGGSGSGGRQQSRRFHPPRAVVRRLLLSHQHRPHLWFTRQLSGDRRLRGPATPPVCRQPHHRRPRRRTSGWCRSDHGNPHRGKVSVRVTESGSDPWSLTFRVPSWATDAWLTDQGQRKRVQPGTAAVTRAFSVDDMVELEMAMSPRWTFPDRRIDSVRGCVAVERGPLVLCVESVDLPQGVEVDMIGIDPAGGLEDSGSAVTATGSLLDVRADGWPYREFPDRGGPGGDLALPLVPYHSWANRGPSTMRVWVPQVHAGI